MNIDISVSVIITVTDVDRIITDIMPKDIYNSSSLPFHLIPSFLRPNLSSLFPSIPFTWLSQHLPSFALPLPLLTRISYYTVFTHYTDLSLILSTAPCSACERSEIRSSICSIPIERRTILSDIPVCTNIRCTNIRNINTNIGQMKKWIVINDLDFCGTSDRDFNYSIRFYCPLHNEW